MSCLMPQSRKRWRRSVEAAVKKARAEKRKLRLRRSVKLRSWTKAEADKKRELRS